MSREWESYEQPVDDEPRIASRRIAWAQFWKTPQEEAHVTAVVKHNLRRSDEAPLAYVHRLAETAGLIPDGSPLFFEGETRADTMRWLRDSGPVRSKA